MVAPQRSFGADKVMLTLLWSRLLWSKQLFSHVALIGYTSINHRPPKWTKQVSFTAAVWTVNQWIKFLKCEYSRYPVCITYMCKYCNKILTCALKQFPIHWRLHVHLNIFPLASSPPPQCCLIRANMIILNVHLFL